jgi:oxaloacetate decarboxylase alpha subunit
MDLTELERLVEMVQGANIRELTLRQDGARITIRKSAPVSVEYGGGLTPFAGGFRDAADFDVDEERGVLEPAPAETTVPVTAPLVGAFRHIKPLIGLGARVTQGQVLCEIWAMNIANDVTAPCTGKIVDILVEDGQPVEYGQELYTVEPAE